MILGFKTKFKDGKETNFADKIIKALYPQVRGESIIPKIHTIRSDIKKRWKAGMLIHFSTGVRTKKFNNFAVGECHSVQDILMVFNPLISGTEIEVYIDGQELLSIEVVNLAYMDGFESLQEFIDYFFTESTLIDFEHIYQGRLINWTKLKYYNF